MRFSFSIMAELAPHAAAHIIARTAQPVRRALLIKRLDCGLWALVCQQVTVLYPGQQENFNLTFEHLSDGNLFCHGSPVMIWLNKFDQISVQPGTVLVAVAVK